MTSAAIRAITTTSASDRYGWSDDGRLYFIPAGLTGASARLVFCPWLLKASNFTGEAGGRYQVDCSAGAVAMALPDGLAVGDGIQVEDATLAFNVNAFSITLAGSGFGAHINGGTASYVDAVKGDKLSIVGVSSGYGVSIK